MNSKESWRLFLNLGTIESYLMYKLIEDNNLEVSDGRSKDTRADTQRR